MLYSPADFKDKIKPQEVKQYLSEKKKSRRPDKKIKIYTITFCWLNILKVNLMAVMEAKVISLLETEEGNLKSFERIGCVYTVLQFKEIKSLCN